jgi:putative nucleotidyltransferase with HDIG domain
MMRPWRRQIGQIFGLLLVSLGAGIAATSLVKVINGATPLDLGIMALALLTGWIRIRVEPSGSVSLAPLVLFVGLLIGRSWASLLGVSVSVLLTARAIGRASWRNSLVEMGEEVIPSGASVLLHASLGGDPKSFSWALVQAYLAVVLVYGGTRLGLGCLRALLFEGVSAPMYARSGGRITAVHVLVLSALSLATFYLYLQAGYFVLALAVVALIEFYYPTKLLSDQREMSFSSLAMIAQAIDAKDPYTARHSRNVAELAVRIARALNLPEEEVRKIRIGALLHDIGKIGVSGRIIRKPSQLDSFEQLAMREHPLISAAIMQPVELLADCAALVRHHHEHYDGSGYPDGLKGEEIPMGARIILVADAFDAMTTDRPYRRGRSRSEALMVLREHASRQFDARVVRALESVIDLI